MRRHTGSAGYSLLELMVVLAIMAIVATAGIPYAFRAADRLTLEADARLVAARVRLLREMAMDQQKDISIVARTDDPATLQPSSGAVIRLSGGTRATIVSDAPDGRMLIGWDGSVSGAVLLTDGSRKLRLRQKGILAPLSVEAVP